MHRNRTTHKGFTLIELMIVIIIICILAILSVTNYRRAQITGNESAAIEFLGLIRSAQVQFQNSKLIDSDNDQIGDYGMLGPEGQEFTLTNPRSDTQPMIDPAFGSGVYHGYTFSVAVDNAGEGEESYVVTARPINYANSGVRSFFMNESGRIYFTIDDRDPTGDDQQL